ncbi:1-deoxy-D-xylulose 5-phosphate reductoisomerase [alpha proteobacterium HIMB5]|nr:1-deoxy-D-xylulose 5-phosphate reductoisomerase [alpha proteobacterium HIMB5]
MKKKIAILGSTGSIGENTLKIIAKDKKNFTVELLSTNKNIIKIYKQAKRFQVKNLIIHNKQSFLNNKTFFKKKNKNISKCK